MKYKTVDGKLIEKDTIQDKFLRCIYRHLLGRILLKFITLPTVSKIVGKFLDSKISCLLISPFIKQNDIPMNEYRKKRYLSYNDFFTREILPQKRPIDKNQTHFISPSDGNVMIYPVRRSSHFLVKNTLYTLRSILQNKKLACKYYNGYCVIIRLCVDNYHRYCYIDNCTQSDAVSIRGRLHTVNPIANDYYPIYKENSREYTILHTENFGDVIQMEVGALMVGKITNKYTKSTNKTILKGTEKGYFEFGGSTIMLFLESTSGIHFRKDILENSILGIETKVKMGEMIGKAET